MISRFFFMKNYSLANYILKQRKKDYFSFPET